MATEEFRQAIINKILNSPEGTPILYYTELGRPSHATVIGYLMAHKELLNNAIQQQQNTPQYKNDEAKAATTNSTINPNNQRSTTEQQVTETHNQLQKDLGGGIVARQEIQDTVKKAKEGLNFEEALSTVNPVFTKEEIEQIKTALNGKPLHVKSVSRYTDPAFLAAAIETYLEFNVKKPFTDPTRTNAIELWTKHDGIPIRRILEACKKYKVAPMVSFSITGLGDTALEKGVLKYTDLMPLIEKLIAEKVLDPRTTTIRIDPILPGVTDMNVIEDIVQRGKAMGIKKYVTSLVQSYGYLDGTERDRHETSGINEALASEGQTYDWDKYYGRDARGKINFKPKKEHIDAIGQVLLKLNSDPEINIETCSFTIPGMKSSACLDPMIIERITGVDVTRADGTYDRDTSRPECMCYGCHSDMFRWNDNKCHSSCAYCYAGHSSASNFE